MPAQPAIFGSKTFQGPGVGGGPPGSAWVYIDLSCGFIYIPLVAEGTVIAVWATGTPTLSGSADAALDAIIPNLYAIDITGDGDIGIHSSDEGRLMAQVFLPGEAIFTTCG